ncbi:MAG: beta-ketoacyl synthase [Gammaproteobacteria bacterium]|nr:beta-ketoacyl synthase [Gammaproteobacteria bacterium]
MTRLPIIAGFGGINAAGRSSGHHGYRRMVIEALSREKALETRAAIAALTGKLKRKNEGWVDNEGNAVNLASYITAISGELDQNTLIRELEDNLFDPNQLNYHCRANLAGTNGRGIEFELKKKQLPTPLPAGWSIKSDTPDDPNKVRVNIEQSFEVLLECFRKTDVNSAGQLPTGFKPELLYQARNHPRALQLTVYAASDAINSLGMDWEIIRQHVPPDQIGVYAGSAMGQLDYNGFGGLLQARLLGKKVTSKQMPLGYAEMPADFINAYLLGNLGTNGTNVAACATFLYNLRQAVKDIQSGSHRVVLVGTTETPIFPESIDGFNTMNALADDASLRKLDGLASNQRPNYRRACRPFANNSGFTLAESAQFVVLFDDELALKLGANILGAANEVYIAADGHKKSITGPGLGNYLSMAKAVAATKNVIGKKALKNRTFVQAHGTGTPQNRTTESHILSQIAGIFGIENWPIAAVKSYLGHSIASSAGDQLVATLGSFAHGILPGILTIDEIAEDVTQENLDFLLAHRELPLNSIDATIINSKGFGGNNASASILAPHIVEKMLEKRHGANALKDYKKRNEQVVDKMAAYDQAMIEGRNNTIYKFDHNVLDNESLEMNESKISINEIEPPISLEFESSYADMCE